MHADQLALLQAVADGRIMRGDGGYAALYLLDGQPVERMQLWWLKKAALIDMPMLGPPRITEDGLKALREA